MALVALLSHSWRFLLLYQHLDLIWEERSCLGRLWTTHSHYSLCTSAEHQCSPCWGLWCGSATSPQRLKIIFHKVFILYTDFFSLKMKNSLSEVLKASNEWEVEKGWFLLAGLAGTGWWGAVTQLFVLLRHSFEFPPSSPNSSFVRTQGLSWADDNPLWDQHFIYHVFIPTDAAASLNLHNKEYIFPSKLTTVPLFCF